VTDLWPAPTARAAVDAVVDVPGSKSMTNRALVLAALADAPTEIRRPLIARDTRLMVQALTALGASVESDAADWRVTPGPVVGGTEVDCGLAGTVMRFVPAVAALADGPVRFDGDPHARLRPMAPVVRALRDLGVEVLDEGREALPFTVVGHGSVRGGELAIDASASSQFVSALLLAGCRYDDGLTVRHVGTSLPSTPHIEMTLAMLAGRGVRVDHPEPTTWRVHPGIPSGGTLAMEPDVSNALPFVAAALVTGGRVRIPGFPHRSAYQPDTEIRAVLEALGATLTDDPDGLLVQGSGRIRGIDLDLGAVGEIVPVVAALAALADSPSTLRGVGHIRGHETDRLAALVTQLGALGCDVTETADGLRILPRPMHGGVFETYDDHRLATAAAVLGLAVPDIQVVDVGTTAKTLPGFTELWRELLA
jgi:3-phosphoshikimate 1-carboxyvinyltransferase